MYFEAIDRMSSECVLDLLANYEEAKGTRQILKITRYVLDSFLDKSIEIEKRIYNMWYSTLFLRIWGLWLKQEKYSINKNWITSNTYTSIELNAHALLVLIEKFRHEPECFLPWLFSSQPCEKFFRQLRSMTSTYSTIVNFDMSEILRRVNRVQIINDIIHDEGKKRCNITLNT